MPHLTNIYCTAIEEVEWSFYPCTSIPLSRNKYSASVEEEDDWKGW